MKITVQNRIFSLTALCMSLTILITLVKNADVVLTLHDRISVLEQQAARQTCKIPENIDLSDISVIDEQLIKAIIHVESRGKADAYNKATGAVGLMQLTPIVYKKVCGLTKKEAFDPDKNIACGSLFFKHLLDKYNGNLEKALLFYNNGHKVRNHEYDDDVLRAMNKEKNNE